jgi:hypothetical protein
MERLAAGWDDINGGNKPFEPQQLRQRTRLMRAYGFKQNSSDLLARFDTIFEQVEGCGSHPDLKDYYSRV